MLTSHKLDAWILPRNVNFSPSDRALEAFLRAWRANQYIAPDCLKPGALANHTFEGGFEGMAIIQSDVVRFVANQQGGFRVFCGARNVTASFVSAMSAWRERLGPRSLSCECGETHAFEALHFRPHAGFYRFGIEFKGIGRASLQPEVAHEVRKLLGDFHIVYRRVG